MNGLSKAIRMPYATLYRAIQEMGGLVKILTIGRSKTVSLDTSNNIVKHYLVISSEEEKAQFLKRHPMINKIASELDTNDTVILFGSYAKGTQRETSDVDLMVINKKGDRSISFSKYDTLFKKKINPVFITQKELRLMLNEESENLGKQALKDHIILRNPENFWEAVLSG